MFGCASRIITIHNSAFNYLDNAMVEVLFAKCISFTKQIVDRHCDPTAFENAVTSIKRLHFSLSLWHDNAV